LFALAVPVAASSCANGIAPADFGDDEVAADSGDTADTTPPTNDDAARKDGGGTYGSGDAGTRPDAAPKNDASASDASAPEASAPETGPPDTGGGGGGVRTDLCQGSDSQQIVDFFGFPIAYSDACDGWYLSGGPAKDCAASGQSCAAYNGSDGYGPYCCYVAPANSNCNQDWGGTPQCLPQ
jgi:hypothetical protein